MKAIYVRVKRDEKYQTLGIEDLTESELIEFTKTFDEEALRRWLVAVCDMAKSWKDCIGVSAMSKAADENTINL